MTKKPIKLTFNGMSQRQAEAIAGNTVGHIVEDFRRAAAEAAEIAAGIYEQEAALEQMAQWPVFMDGLYDEDGEPRSPLSFLDDLPFGNGFDGYGGSFTNFRM